jgi:hypothetical protein
MKVVNAGPRTQALIGLLPQGALFDWRDYGLFICGKAADSGRVHAWSFELGLEQLLPECLMVGYYEHAELALGPEK